jgi:hypothetical protein
MGIMIGLLWVVTANQTLCLFNPLNRDQLELTAPVTCVVDAI